MGNRSTNAKDMGTDTTDYRHLFESAPFGYVILDEKGVIHDINDTGAGFLGIGKNDLISQYFSSFIADGCQNIFWDHIKKALENGEISSCEIEMANKDGSVFCVRLASISETRGKKHFRLKTAMTKIARPATLRDNEPKYRTIFENAPLGIFRSTPHGKIIEVNPALAKMLGYDTSEDVFKHIDTIGNDIYVHPERRKEILRIIKDNPATARFENKFRRKDGTIGTAILNVKMIHDVNGAPMFFEGMVEDVTDWKQMEEDILSARKIAEEANRAKSGFLANMSHEIRTPVNGIIGAVKMILDSQGLEDDHREILEIVHESARVLMILINDILDFSKIEAGKFELVESDFDLHDTVEKIAQTFAIEAGKKRLDLKLAVAKEVPRIVQGDSERLGQIIRNLVSNAIKFTEQGEVIINVNASESEDSRVKLLFSICDTGIGIWPEKIPELFQSFSQIDHSYSKKYKGTGLGLAISKKLVGMMDGNIWVDSKRGHGTTFYFTILCKKARLDDTVERDIVSAELPDIPPLRILLAEDNTLSKMTLAHFLTKAGHNVSTVSNGIEVMYALKKKTFDVILMDVQMPEMDGVETTKCIRNASPDEFNPRIPVIALTAYAMKGDRQRFLDAGMDEYLSKPMEIEEVLQVIARVVNIGEFKGKTEIRQDTGGDYVSDLRKLLQRFHGQETFLKELFQNFIHESDLTMKKLNGAILDEDLRKLSTAAHSMVNITGFIKLYSAVNLSRRIEQAAESGDIDEAADAMKALESVLKMSIDFIKDLSYV